MAVNNVLKTIQDMVLAPIEQKEKDTAFYVQLCLSIAAMCKGALDMGKTDENIRLLDIAEKSVMCCHEDLNQDWSEEIEFIKKLKGEKQ